LPNLLLFQLVFPTLAPLSLVVLLVSACRGMWVLPLIWFAVFVLVDLFSAAVALRLEKRSLTDLWVVLLQRFYYRPFMYVVTLRSLLAAIDGNRQHWNKLERRGLAHPHRAVRAPLDWDLPAQPVSSPAA
jgi:hypothetical protein